MFKEENESLRIDNCVDISSLLLSVYFSYYLITLILLCFFFSSLGLILLRSVSFFLSFFLSFFIV